MTGISTLKLHSWYKSQIEQAPRQSIILWIHIVVLWHKKLKFNILTYFVRIQAKYSALKLDFLLCFTYSDCKALNSNYSWKQSCWKLKTLFAYSIWATTADLDFKIVLWCIFSIFFSLPITFFIKVFDKDIIYQIPRYDLFNWVRQM